MEFKETIQSYSEQPLTKQLLLEILKDYKRPHDKINELVKKNLLIQVKRGLYIPGTKLNIASPEPFLIANHLYGPSYISLESALSYWGMIPEKVVETSSVTTNLSKTFNTGAGRFTYTYIKLPYYSFGLKKVELTKKQVVIMASPEKALCDKIITSSGILLRSIIQTKKLLLEDLRLDEQLLQKLETAIIETWIVQSPKAKSLSMLVKTIKSL